jgi:hypothetical protein
MGNVLQEYFACAAERAEFSVDQSLSARAGFFRFGESSLFGRCAGIAPAQSAISRALPTLPKLSGASPLPFDPSEALGNLRFERYISSEKSRWDRLTNLAYYLIRPMLSVDVRKHLQRVRLSGWDRIPFPKWPVDTSVDDACARLLALLMEAAGIQKVPFIWFWPDGASACAIVTHDVESVPGRDACELVMDLDDEFGIKSSFQVVPEVRYEVTPEYLKSMTERGFEVAVQDLNHDGRLYSSRAIFNDRVKRINEYGRQWNAKGFRAAVLYRNLEWLPELEFSYDMSVPNVAHLDPQHGGCCTVMPYFIGNLVELPVTTTQDYTLFYILGDYTIDLWKKQLQSIGSRHGLANFIIHPDYITEQREQSVFRELLRHLADMRASQGLWIPRPDQVDSWWRLRSKMSIVEDEHGVRISGEGSERARLAFAIRDGDKLRCELTPLSGQNGSGTSPAESLVDSSTHRARV